MSAPAVDDARGFTLIELLVVIVVMGILASIAVLAIGSNKGNKTACKADFLKVQAAQDDFYARSNRFATGVSELMTPPATPSPSIPPLVRSTPSTTDYAISTDGTGSVFVAVPGSASPSPTATTTLSCPP